MIPSLRDDLRHTTRARHAALDEAVTSTLSTHAGYVSFLQASLATIAALEAPLARRGIVAPAGRTALLQADLAELGAPPPSTVHARVALPPSAAEAYGVAYVVEGSALGGVFLAKVIEDRLGAPTRYLRLRGADTARAWGAFVTRLDRWGESATPNERAASARAAARTLDAFRDALAALPEAWRPDACTLP